MLLRLLLLLSLKFVEIFEIIMFRIRVLLQTPPRPPCLCMEIQGTRNEEQAGSGGEGIDACMRREPSDTGSGGRSGSRGGGGGRGGRSRCSGCWRHTSLSNCICYISHFIPILLRIPFRSSHIDEVFFPCFHFLWQRSQCSRQILAGGCGITGLWSLSFEPCLGHSIRHRDSMRLRDTIEESSLGLTGLA